MNELERIEIANFRSQLRREIRCRKGGQRIDPGSTGNEIGPERVASDTNRRYDSDSRDDHARKTGLSRHSLTLFAIRTRHPSEGGFYPSALSDDGPRLPTPRSFGLRRAGSCCVTHYADRKCRQDNNSETPVASTNPAARLCCYRPANASPCRAASHCRRNTPQGNLFPREPFRRSDPYLGPGPLQIPRTPKSIADFRHSRCTIRQRTPSADPSGTVESGLRFRHPCLNRSRSPQFTE